MEDLSGQTIGGVVINPNFRKTAGGATQWEYTCKCGFVGWAFYSSLKQNPNFCCKECRKKIQKERSTTHGMRYTVVYACHTNIKTRITNPKHKSFKDYGGRGIKMCAGIHKFEDFNEIIKPLGERPPGMTIDREDNKKHYSCGKCDECILNGWLFNLRWATDFQQANNRRSNKYITDDNGRTMTFSEWARETGLDKTTIRKRWLKGWTASKVLSLDDFRK